MSGDPLNLIRVMPAKGQDTMPTSIFLARLMGPMGVAIGAGLLINPRIYRRVAEEFLESQALIYFSGLIAGSAGLAVVVTHNVWSADWRIVVTLLGWIAFLTAAMRIVAPTISEPIGRFIFERPRIHTVAGAITLALGLVLSYAGFIA
jgi:hypothetical protein